jgi:hypothetical protein
MATIDSIELYMGLSSAKSGFNITVSVYALGAYSNNPEVGTLIGSKAQDVSVIPLESGAGPDWVTWTFDTPITISSNDFAGISVTHNTTAFNATSVKMYYATSFNYYTSGAKDGTERAYRYSSGWISMPSNEMWAYKMNCSGCTDNDATSPSGSSTMGANARFGVRAYADALGAPGKATNPSPTNAATGQSTNLAELSWTEGTGTVNYEQVYFGQAGNLSLQESLSTIQTFDLNDYGLLPLETGTQYQWRIDSVNDSGTTTGDTWSFTTLTFSPPDVSGSDFKTIKRLCACAENRFWYEDI